MYWLTWRNSKLSVRNKLLIYKIIINPIWTYWLQICGMAAKLNIKKIENLQSIILRKILDAQWYVKNDNMRKTLGIPIIKEEIRKRASTHQHKIKNHRNPLTVTPYYPEDWKGNTRSLTNKWNTAKHNGYKTELIS